MHNTQIIRQFVDAPNLTALRIAFSKLCTSVGEVDVIDILVCGSYGNFCAFCMATMKTAAAEDRLLRQYGFQKIGGKIYLPRALSPEFERRALARVA